MRKQNLRMKMQYKYWIGAALIGIASCTPAKKLVIPETTAVPEKFVAESDVDTNSIAQISWKNFFQDEKLIRLVDSALAKNWDFLSAYQRIEAARAQYRRARGAMAPTVNLQASASGDRYGKYTMTGVGNFDTNLSPNITDNQKVNTDFTPEMFLGARSIWEVDLFGKLKNQKVAAHLQMMAAEKSVQLFQTALVAEISTLYYDLISLDKELEVILKNIELQTAATEIVEVQKIGGRATELAVQQFKAQLLNTKALEKDVRTEINAIENQLNVLIGRFPQKIDRAQNFDNITFTENLATGLPASMILNRPDIQEAELVLASKKASVKSARAALLPGLTISPQVGFTSFNASVLFNPSSLAFGVLGGLTQPFLNRSALIADIEQNNASAMEAFYQYQKTIQNSFAEVNTQINKIGFLKDKLQLKFEESSLMNAAITTSKELYLAGYANYLEVITSQKSALETELDLIKTRRDLLNSSIILYRSLGGGWN
jgi:multidrug efflux system outer membrane protein